MISGFLQILTAFCAQPQAPHPDACHVYHKQSAAAGVDPDVRILCVSDYSVKNRAKIGLKVGLYLPNNRKRIVPSDSDRYSDGILSVFPGRQHQLYEGLPPRLVPRPQRTLRQGRQQLRELLPPALVRVTTAAAPSPRLDALVLRRREEDRYEFSYILRSTLGRFWSTYFPP